MYAHIKTLTACALLVLLLGTAAIYRPGLEGPFLFDDVVHITKNENVHITGLDFTSLRQAWNSSPMKFPSNRPLSQLTFGVDHALFGLSAKAYKTGNLLIHLLCGLLVYLLAYRLGRFLETQGLITEDHRVYRLALTTTAFWLLTPLNLTPVLYTVQRMAGLSTLFVLLALLCYVEGRRHAATGGRSWPWLLGSIVAAGLGALAKENAVLFPVFLVVLEWTLLRRSANRPDGTARTLLAFAVLAICGGIYYLVSHPQIASFTGRPFSMEERLLTEARVLWLYVQMLLLPRPELFGFYHDDFAISHSLFEPWPTLPAVLGIAATSTGALIWAKRLPVPAFAILFFLSGHLLESTLLPLELVFEHRNYLPVFGPLFGLAYLLTAWPGSNKAYPLLAASAVALSILFGVLTYDRAKDWASIDDLVIAQVEHHPASSRANFHAAMRLMHHLARSAKPSETYRAARELFNQMRRIDPENLDALFGLMVLNLHVGRGPEPEWIAALENKLRHGLVGPTKFTAAQFSALVKWHIDGRYPLPESLMRRLFKAALGNPRFDRFARAGIASAYRAYLDRVLGRPQEALPFAEKAVDLWPQRWHYHRRLVEVLLKLNHIGQAQAALRRAARLDPYGTHAQLMAKLQHSLQTALARNQTDL